MEKTITRTVRNTNPTTSFTLPVAQIDWIARKAAALGVSKSEYLRRQIADLMAADDELAA